MPVAWAVTAHCGRRLLCPGPLDLVFASAPVAAALAGGGGTGAGLRLCVACAATAACLWASLLLRQSPHSWGG